ncbi:hypothetical protein AAY473_000091 [Plecturocebus cupreus]
MPVIPALWEAKRGGSPKGPWSARPAVSAREALAHPRTGPGSDQPTAKSAPDLCPWRPEEKKADDPAAARAQRPARPCRATRGLVLQALLTSSGHHAELNER